MRFLILLSTLLSVFPGDLCQLEDRVDSLQAMVEHMTRQMMNQQMNLEEYVRATTDTGIMQIRYRSSGGKSYKTETHSGNSIGAMHNHANNIRTVGLGDFIANLNGVQFRTRHNDYGLKMPSRTETGYHAVEDLPFPEVPPAVLSKASLEDQMTELREWFKAWRDEDHSVRDYRPYFRPVLCYMEGAWTTNRDFDEPFKSDRHSLDTASFRQLQEQIQFTTATGSKNLQENLAILPIAYMNNTNGTTQMVQWNYRILCHPLKTEVKVSNLEPIDDLANRLPRGRTFKEHVNSRSARFRVVSAEDTKYWTLEDELMYEIPGKDNYPGNITDGLFGTTKTHVITDQLLNAAYYTRTYKVSEKDANQEFSHRRGYSDDSLYTALTSQERVATVQYPWNCKTASQIRSGKCQIFTQKVSYAMPLEIVFLTPLHAWNPLNLQYKGEYSSDEGKTVFANSKNGGAAKPYNGTNSKLFFQTPFAFYNGWEGKGDSADTTRGKVWVLDQAGTAHEMSSTGVRIHLPYIPEVGSLRTRFPICPVANEGNAIWKELESLRDVMFDIKNHLKYFPTPPPIPEQTMFVSDPARTHTTLTLTASNSRSMPTHEHSVKLSRTEHDDLKFHNQTLWAYTDKKNNHTHSLLLDYNELAKRFEYRFCDKNPRCFDGHLERLVGA
ncbi:hypothetical protein ACOMHN_058749 [Nucella lapillus]